MILLSEKNIFGILFVVYTSILTEVLKEWRNDLSLARMFDSCDLARTITIISRSVLRPLIPAQHMAEPFMGKVDFHDKLMGLCLLLQRTFEVDIEYPPYVTRTQRTMSEYEQMEYFFKFIEKSAHEWSLAYRARKLRVAEYLDEREYYRMLKLLEQMDLCCQCCCDRWQLMYNSKNHN